VNDIWTTSTHQKTAKGIGPGASVTSMRRAYPRARCYTQRGLRWHMLCILVSQQGGHATETDFLFSAKLAKVEVYFA
jgi:hypothetical protein